MLFYLTRPFLFQWRNCQVVTIAAKSWWCCILAITLRGNRNIGTSAIFGKYYYCSEGRKWHSCIVWLSGSFVPHRWLMSASCESLLGLENMLTSDRAAALMQPYQCWRKVENQTIRKQTNEQTNKITLKLFIFTNSPSHTSK